MAEYRIGASCMEYAMKQSIMHRTAGIWHALCEPREMTLIKGRNDRQDVIRDIVRSKSIRTQHALVSELKEAGFSCTQATVSRDIADMGLRKLPEGVYVLAEDMHLQRMMSELAVGVDRANNLVLVMAQPGTAPGIAAAIDAAGLPEIVGTLAGNDTILVVTREEEEGKALEAHLDKLRTAR